MILCVELYKSLGYMYTVVFVNIAVILAADAMPARCHGSDNWYNWDAERGRTY